MPKIFLVAFVLALVGCSSGPERLTAVEAAARKNDFLTRHMNKLTSEQVQDINKIPYTPMTNNVEALDRSMERIRADGENRLKIDPTKLGSRRRVLNRSLKNVYRVDSKGNN